MAWNAASVLASEGSAARAVVAVGAAAATAAAATCGAGTGVAAAAGWVAALAVEATAFSDVDVTSDEPLELLIIDYDVKGENGKSLSKVAQFAAPDYKRIVSHADALVRKLAADVSPKWVRFRFKELGGKE